MLSCFKFKRSPKSETTGNGNTNNPTGSGTHACCCCCQANCANSTLSSAPVTTNGLKANGNCDNIFNSVQTYPPTSSLTVNTNTDGQIFSKGCGNLPITDSDSGRGIPRSLSWGDDDSDPEAKMMYDFDSQEIAHMPVSRDSPCYNMNHPKRGMAIIFNFDHWDNTMIPELGLTPRRGSEKDKNDLEKTLKKLDFDVHCFNSCGNLELWDIIRQIREADHSRSDCLVVCIMTHGEKNTIFVRDGTQIPVNLIWEAFEAHRCPSLAGKPKIFIIQACRGSRYDNGTVLAATRRVIPESVNDEIDAGSFSYVIPNSADFLIAFSCPLGHYSWRNPQLGSWFIQSICKTFDAHAYDMDIQSLFTEIARDVALNYESNTTHYASHKKKQVTSTLSTLIRKVVFKPKPKMSVDGAEEVTEVLTNEIRVIQNEIVTSAILALENTLINHLNNNTIQEHNESGGTSL